MTKLRVAATAAVLAILCAACRQDVATNARWGNGSTTAALTSGRLVAGSTAAIPLDIEITSPRPGSWLATPDVTIAGVVRRPDPSQVSAVSVAGSAATLGSAGAFQASVHLGGGLATVTVLVTDSNGIVTATTASYMVGATTPLTTPVANAVVARLDATAFPQLGPLLSDELDKLDFNAILIPLSPIHVTSLLGGLVNVEIDIDSVTHGPWSAQLTPLAGGFGVAAQVPDVHVAVRVHDPSHAVIPIQIYGEANAALAVATTTASLNFTPGVTPTVTLAPPPVNLQGTSFIAQGSLPSAVLPLVQGTLTTFLEKTLTSCLEKNLTRIVNKALAHLTQPVNARLVGVDFVFDVNPTLLDVEPAGMQLALDADATAPAAGLTAPGWLSVAGPPPVLGPGHQAAVSLSPDLFSKALTVLWQSGLAQVDVDAAKWSTLGAGLPSLDAQGFSKLVPELLAVLPPSTPLLLRLRPGLPPSLVFGNGPTLATLGLGELHLELWADVGAGGSLVLALDLTLHGQVPVEPTIANDVLTVSLGPIRPRFFFSVAGQPLVRVDSLGLQTRLSIVLDALLPQFLSKVQIALPQINGQPLKNVTLSADGTLGDHLTLAGDL